MIILDTNVLSELMRRDPEARVLRWMEAQSQVALFTTAITEAEVLYGVKSRLKANAGRICGRLRTHCFRECWRDVCSHLTVRRRERFHR